MGTACYIDNLTIDSSSLMIEVSLKGGSYISPQAASYLSNITLSNNSVISGIDVGFSSYISNIDLNSGVMTEIKLDMGCFIDSFQLYDSYVININLGGGKIGRAHV